jgi:hypothetical protein
MGFSELFAVSLQALRLNRDAAPPFRRHRPVVRTAS